MGSGIVGSLTLKLPSGLHCWYAAMGMDGCLRFWRRAARRGRSGRCRDSGTTADLRGIDNVGGGVAWASGTNGTVLRTEDGGYLWQPCAVPPGAEHLDFRGIQAFDANTAIVMSSGKGDLSRLYKTTDGCQTWKLVFTNPDKDGFWDALIMTDQNIGTVHWRSCAGGRHRGQFRFSDSDLVFPTYHTIDGGERLERN